MAVQVDYYVLPSGPMPEKIVVGHSAQSSVVGMNPSYIPERSVTVNTAETIQGGDSLGTSVELPASWTTNLDKSLSEEEAAGLAIGLGAGGACIADVIVNNNMSRGGLKVALFGTGACVELAELMLTAIKCEVTRIEPSTLTKAAAELAGKMNYVMDFEPAEATFAQVCTVLRPRGSYCSMVGAVLAKPVTSKLGLPATAVISKSWIIQACAGGDPKVFADFAKQHNLLASIKQKVSHSVVSTADAAGIDTNAAQTKAIVAKA